MTAKDIFEGVKSILVIDWPSREVPEQLALAGFEVIVRGGPGPQEYSSYQAKGGQVVACRLGHPPDRADLIYCYRPVSELPEILAAARQLHARTLWTQSGRGADGQHDPKGCWLPEDELRKTRELVQAAGLNHVSQPYIADAVRELRADR